MREVEAEIEIEGAIAEVWAVYFDADGWRRWVDGFVRVTAGDGYPERGGTLSWESTPAGRGRVTERVMEHEPRRLHRVEYSDPGSSGQLETRFEMVPSGDGTRRTRVSLSLSYELREAGPLSAITDFLFIRSQMRDSLERTLADLRLEVAARGEAPGTPSSD
jgi:uncharacterized protein YndB with AHSA1/START domain